MKRKTVKVKVQKIHSLDFLPKSENLVSWSIAYNGSLLNLMLEGEPDYRINKSDASFAKLYADKENIYKIYVVHFDDIKIVNIGLLTENFHFVQLLPNLLPNDEILLVRGRAKSDQDKNAHVYTIEGQPQRHFSIGDGVQDVQVAENGDIWVSYFDEGVYSGSALSQAGLSAFNSDGGLCYQFSAENIKPIDDCYALNLCSSNEVWCYYYTSFPLVRVRDKKAEVITAQTPVNGATAFAVNEQYTLYWGSYKNRNSLHLHNRKEDKTVYITPVTESREVLSNFEAIGRGNILWLYLEDSVYRLELGKEI